jgi:hypothetical protein
MVLPFLPNVRLRDAILSLMILCSMKLYLTVTELCLRLDLMALVFKIVPYHLD